MNSTASIGHDAIAFRAHQLWQEAGQPDGRDAAHWLQAERELHAQLRDKDSGAGARGNPAGPAMSAKPVPAAAKHSTDYAHPGVTTDSLHHHRNR
jgi:hypothetical protein